MLKNSKKILKSQKVLKPPNCEKIEKVLKNWKKVLKQSKIVKNSKKSYKKSKTCQKIL